MVSVDTIYEGALHCKAVHGPSGATIATDAPKDNMGKGECFSPTDLVATALGSCMLTVMGIAAKAMNVDLRGTKVRVEKEMLSKPERKIGKLKVSIYIPATVTEEQKKKLTDAALHCPVHKSLSPDIQIPVEFIWS